VGTSARVIEGVARAQRSVHAMSTQIREIVDLLNKPPFSHNFSL
jgi:hypothetical protein